MAQQSWQALEQAVRNIASLIWNATAVAEKINEVKIDAVLKVRTDYWVCVEVSKEKTLAKLRTDLAKFQTIKPYLSLSNIYAECLFVTEDEPPESLVISGNGVGIKVFSAQTLRRMLFDYSKYMFARSNKRFGSAIDPHSGVNDNYKYIPVKYLLRDSSDSFTITEIISALSAGKAIILLGNFGVGKSRCIREIFTESSKYSNAKSLYPIAIDLRDNWGVKRGTEVLRRHFEDLGLSDMADSCIKLQDNGALMLLLDGFDEIGTQSWIDNPQRLREIRKKSLEGVKDLIQRTKGGKLITGRPHYFDSDAEMFESLGLPKDKVKVLVCGEEFTVEEMRQYLAAIGKPLQFPDWLPRRPLMCQILASLDDEALAKIAQSAESDSATWELAALIRDVSVSRMASVA